MESIRKAGERRTVRPWRGTERYASHQRKTFGHSTRLAKYSMDATVLSFKSRPVEKEMGEGVREDGLDGWFVPCLESLWGERL